MATSKRTSKATATKRSMGPKKLIRVSGGATSGKKATKKKAI